MANYTDLMSLFDDIGDAINDKGVSGQFYPNQMATAIRSIPDFTPSGNFAITANGIYDVTDYATASVNITTGVDHGVFITEEDDPAGGKIMYVTGVDLSQDTVDAAHLVSGYTAHDRSGNAITGTFGGIELNNQAKSITPSTSQQIVSPDFGYTGLSSVTVAAIPSQYKDTSDATAIAANILDTKTAYIGTGKITGSMPNNGSWNRTLDQTTTNITIPAGYHDGTGVINHTTVSVPNPTINVNTSTGVITASGSWTRGYTTNNSYSNTSSLSTQVGTTITPTESEQTAVAANKYTLDAVKVAAIPTDYVGSGISQRTAPDITFSKGGGDAYYTVPAGYYSSNITKYLTVVYHSQPSVSINPSTGLITASHAQNEGYVYSTNTQTDTLQLTTKGATTYTPGTTNQTIASGTYLTGTQTIAGDANLVSSNIISGKSIFGVNGSVVINKYYTGSTAPNSSLGNNGDIYFQS